MGMKISCVWLMLAGVAMPSVQAWAAPKPDLVSRTWQLRFTYSKPEPIAVKDVDGQIRWYWFMAYMAVNETEVDRQFLPHFTIATEQGDIIGANHDISPRVFDAIKQRLRNPLLESPMNVSGMLRQGQDQAKQSVAIWPSFKHDVDMLNVFVSGLSGETAHVLNPRTAKPIVDPQSLKQMVDPATGNPPIQPRPLLLRKTLMLEYHLPGSVIHPQRQRLTLRKKRWVMR